MALETPRANLNLGLHALVEAEQRQIGMGSGRGEKFHVPLLLEVTPGADQVSSKVVHQEGGRAAVPFLPQARQPR